MPKITNTFEDLINKYKAKDLPKVNDFLLSIARRSRRTAFAYSFGLDHLNRFIEQEYDYKYNIQTILESLESNKINVYKLLNSFVSYLQNDTVNGHDLSSLSIKMYVISVKSYLSYHGIDVIQQRFKHMVKMPTIYHESEEVIDEKDVRQILLACNNRRLKAYLLVLASSGCRAIEALAIRNKDLNFKSSPTAVDIREDYSKTRTERTVWISDEASRYLQQWLTFKYRNRHAENKNMKNRTYDDNDMVFSITSSRDPQGLYPKVLVEFQKVLEIAGLKSRKDSGVYKRRKISFHSFRRFVKTVIADATNSDYSEWFIGHRGSTYYRRKELDRKQLYAEKCMKYLTFLDYSTLEATGQNIEKQLSEKDKQIEAMQEQLKQLQQQVNKMQIGESIEIPNWTEEDEKELEDKQEFMDYLWNHITKEDIDKFHSLKLETEEQETKGKKSG